MIFNCVKPKGETEDGWVFFSHVLTFSGEEDYDSLPPGVESVWTSTRDPTPQRDAATVSPYLLFTFTATDLLTTPRHKREKTSGRRPPGVSFMLFERTKVRRIMRDGI